MSPVIARVCLILAIVYTSGISACRQYTSCATCLQSSPECVWCRELNNTFCFDRNTNDEASCDDQFEEDLSGNLNLIPAEGGSLISPGGVRIRARAKQLHRFNVTINIPFNYPLDFYYLMDFSCSMFNDLETIKDLSVPIVQTIQQNLTNDFRLGFGAYSEKASIPFSLTRSPSPFCSEASPDQQAKPFDYRHFLSLTSNTSVFTDRIDKLNITSNLDPPESLLDALMQAVTCDELIGWRPSASHIVLLATDNTFHLAGDGKLVGALRPNDASCHMSPTPSGDYVYDMGLELDYPSIGLISDVLRKNRIVPIFAISGSRSTSITNTKTYEALTAQLETNSYLGALNRDSSNIAELIIDGYNSLSQNVQLLVPKLSGVEITVKAVCDESVGEACTNIRRGDNATFEVSVQVTNCSIVEQLQNFTIEYSFLGVSVDIELAALCDCNCEQSSETGSSYCSNNGHLVCGQCECNSARFSPTCECTLSDISDTSNQGNGHNMCQTGIDDLMCSGRGTCYCNKCQCEANFTGDACEELVCKFSQCPVDEIGSTCGGTTQGECLCNGTCQCSTGFSGDQCNCSTDVDSCLNQQVLCSSRGECVCGRCECDDRYTGALCERCITPPCPGEATCGNTQPCVVCTLFDRQLATVTPPLNCGRRCHSDPVVLAPVAQDNFTIQGFATTRCVSQDDRRCTYTYYYAEDADSVLLPLYIEDIILCSQGTSDSSGALVWIIPVAIIAGLLILGIIILAIIKLILVALDYVEVKRFERSVRDAEGKLTQTSQPLYQSPVVQYQNPAYGKEKNKDGQ